LDGAASSTFKQVLQKLAIQISGRFFTPETSKELIREKLNTVELMNTVIELLMSISLQVDQPEGSQEEALDCSTLI